MIPIFPTIFVVSSSVTFADDWARRNIHGGDRKPVGVGGENLSALRGARNKIIMVLPNAYWDMQDQYLFDDKRNIIIYIKE